MRLFFSFLTVLVALIATIVQANQAAQTETETIAASMEALEGQSEEGGIEPVLDPKIDIGGVDWEGVGFVDEIAAMLNGGKTVTGKTVQMLPGPDALDLVKDSDVMGAWLVARFSQKWVSLSLILKEETNRDVLLMAAMRLDILISRDQVPLSKERDLLEERILPALKKISQADGSIEGVKSFVRVVKNSFRLLEIGSEFPQVADMVGKKFGGDGGRLIVR